MLQLVSPFIIIYKALYLFIVSLTGNYGISLVLLSFITFLILLPFNKKAQQLQRKERKLQAILAPQIKAIKLNYSGQEQYEKLKRLYHRYAYHPLYAMRSVVGVLLQLPFLATAYYMLSGLPDIQGVPWGIIQNLGIPDQLLGGINLLPFIMTLVTVAYAFVMPDISKKERLQSVIIGLVFLVLLYAAPSALLIFWTSNLLWSLLFNVFEEKLHWVGSYVEKNELAFNIIIALALTVGLLVPLEVYIKNADQLWFSLHDVLKHYLTTTVELFVVLLSVYLICWCNKLRVIYLSVLLGLLFGVFLQSHIISIDYGLFDGHEIEWEKYTKIGILNSFIWLFCLGEVFARFKRVQFDTAKIKRVVKPITFGIIVVQCVVLSYTLAKFPLPESAAQGKQEINVLTTENMYNVSKNDNIIIFLLDAFEASVFEQIIAKEPSEIKEFKDFTFYPDTTSVFGYTHYSIPQILTGKTYYNDMSFDDYLDAAWNDNSFFKELKKHNYDINIFGEGSYISKNAPIANLINEKIKIDNNTMKVLDNLVLFRMTPHYIKKTFYVYNPNEWANLLADRAVHIYKPNDKRFYLDLKKGLTTLSGTNCFRFYYLIGPHFPYIYDREMEYVTEKGTEYEHCMGILKIVKEYIRQMKQMGIFDNSTFVIMADHGVHNKIGNRPLLCIKQPNVNNEEIKVSNKAISFTQFLPMLTQRFRNEKEKDELTLSVRKFYLQKERDLIEYSIVGSAKDLSSWHKGKVLKSWYKKQDSIYVLGTEIDCTDKNREFEKYQGQGWFIKPDTYGTYSVGYSSDLLFQIKDYQNQNLKFSFTALAWLGDLPSRKVKVFVNDKFASEFIIDNRNEDFSFKIDSNMVRDGKVRLRFDIDHSGIALKVGFQDLGILWKKLKIEAE